MAQKSYWWTTGGAGDGATEYSRLDWANFAKIMGACHGEEGIAPAAAIGTLAATDGSEQVTVAAGVAVVDGKPYINDAPVVVAIPAAVGGGNTRIDRIVLRADWTAQTVRIHRIAGTDAASPTAPAATTTSGDVYDVLAWRALVDTSGVVTLTDERAWARVETDDLADGAVDTDKIADEAVTTAKIEDEAVTADKAGAGVPVAVLRRGGSLTRWSTPGSTNYDIENVEMIIGCSPYDAAASSTTTVVVAFGNVPSFAERPVVIPVVFEPAINSPLGIQVESVTDQSVTFRIWHRDAAETIPAGAIMWVAIGPRL